MNLSKKVMSVLCVLVLLGGMIGMNAFEVKETGTEQSEATEEAGEIFSSPFSSADAVLHIWYTDETLTDYINSVALNYYEDTNVRVVPVLQSGLDYLDAINEASLAGNEDAPDLYIITNDCLEKANLMGLANPVWDTSSILSNRSYSETALNAVTYKGQKVGYPFYFETSVLLYNKTYLQDIAQSEIENAAQEQENSNLIELYDMEGVEVTDDGETGQEAQEPAVENAPVSAETEEKAREIAPSTIDDILEFADNYNAPENVEAIFKWDVSDIFYNYFMTGNYINVGGESGDDISAINIYNEEAIRCLEVYQNLNQFFSIDADEVSYDSVLQEFMEGKTIFTVATTDAVAKLEEAKQKGEFPYEYEVTTLPDVSDTLLSRGLSVTYAAAINGYGRNYEYANEFAKYLTYDFSDRLYSRSGKVASKMQAEYDYPALAGYMQEYSDSIPLPKMLETSNFWIQLEICFTKAWMGEDVNGLLKELSQQIMTQATGQEYQEEEIVMPETEETEADIIIVE